MSSRTKKVVSKFDSYYSGRYTDPAIPDGYRYAYGTWSDGFVIERIKDGSCFTFVPVGALKDNGTFDGKKFNQRFGRREWYKVPDELGEEPIKRIIWNQLQSIREYGGFYISTYRISKSISSMPQSLNGRKPWTCIDFNCAVEIAQMFEWDSRVESHLVFGAEYDSTLEWFLETDAMSIDDITTLNECESNVSHRTNRFFTYNENEKLLTKNIFDFGGSCHEWTQEMVRGKEIKAVIRGGSNVTSGRRSPIADRNACSTFIKSPNIGFRIALSIP